MAQITYDNKVTLNPQPSIARINKVTDDDMNEIKSVVNTNDTNTTANTTAITNLQSYSTNEVDTGKTWINGEKIYRKCYSGTAGSNAAVVVDTLTSIDRIISYSGFSTSAYDWSWSIPNAQSGYEIALRMTTNSKELQLKFGVNYGTTDKWNLILEYTKTS